MAHLAESMDERSVVVQEELETIQRSIVGPRLFVTTANKTLRLTAQNKRIFKSDYSSVAIGTKQ